MIIEGNKMQEIINGSGKDKSIGCLLIHGFGGSTEEVKPLADYLVKLGYRVECPALKGHTGKRGDLKGCTYRDWINSAKASYDKLQIEFGKVLIVGFSMGGLIAFQIAAKNSVSAIVTLNTPVYYWDLKRVAINIMEDIKCKRCDNMRRYMNSIRRLPLSAAINFRLLLSKTKSLIKDINLPVFIAQALEDDTVRKKSAIYIYDNISTKRKIIKYYERSGHCILWDKASSKVIKDVSDFIEKIDLQNKI